MKNLLVMAAFMLLVFSLRSMIWEPKPAPRSSTQVSDEPTTISPRDRVILYALSLVDKPYRGGGTQPDQGFDCSGFLQHVFKASIGYQLPRSSSAMAGLGQAVDLDQVRKGDLLFFTGSDAESEEVGHVALVVAAQENIHMIHASSRGVVVDVYQAMDYYQDRFLQARRLEL